MHCPNLLQGCSLQGCTAAVITATKKLGPRSYDIGNPLRQCISWSCRACLFKGRQGHILNRSKRRFGCVGFLHQNKRQHENGCSAGNTQEQRSRNVTVSCYASILHTAASGHWFDYILGSLSRCCDGPFRPEQIILCPSSL